MNDVMSLITHYQEKCPFKATWVAVTEHDCFGGGVEYEIVFSDQELIDNWDGEVCRRYIYGDDNSKVYRVFVKKDKRIKDFNDFSQFRLEIPVDDLIGKLCWFYNKGDCHTRIGILDRVMGSKDNPVYITTNNGEFNSCVPVRKNEIKFYGD